MHPQRPVALAAIALACSAFAACAAQADALAKNATELRDLLRGPATAATLTPIKTEGWCGPQGCFVDAGELRLDRDKGGLARADDQAGKRIQVVEHKSAGGPALPDLDWTPLDAYEVSLGGKRWGSCMEFTHAGLGKSGVYQRWTSVMLVPFDGNRPAGMAHRFVGYWAGCDSLQAGATPTTVALPVIERNEPAAGKPLRLVGYQCTAKGCDGKLDARTIDGDPTGESGALAIGKP